MNAAIVKDNIITNVIVIAEGTDPASVGALPLPEDKWIGDIYIEPEPPEPETNYVTWDELDSAYREGVNSIDSEG